MVLLAALGEGRGDGDSVGADLDADLGICDEVMIPVWTGGRTRLGCEHDPSVTIGQVHDGVDPGLPALGSHGVKKEKGRTLKSSADLSAVVPELLDSNRSALS